MTTTGRQTQRLPSQVPKVKDTVMLKAEMVYAEKRDEVQYIMTSVARSEGKIDSSPTEISSERLTSPGRRAQSGKNHPTVHRSEKECLIRAAELVHSTGACRLNVSFSPPGFHSLKLRSSNYPTEPR